MDRILNEDINSFELPGELSERLRGASVIVTGATGLIGSMFVRCVGALGLGIRWILPVRNREKALALFSEPSDPLDYGQLEIIETDLVEFFQTTGLEADYIVHCASPTNGAEMSRRPAETFLLAVESTRAALDYSRKRNIKGMVYVSSLEYYGQRFDDTPVSEEMNGEIDHASARSSYPLGKQAAEYLCFSYALEYGVKAMSARLTQTFGAGVAAYDPRVFAQFARSVISGTDITLHSEGRSAKPYCYTTDCIAALVYILLKGSSGKAYNVSTPGTYVSIRRLAEIFRDTLNPEIHITVSPRDCGYAPETRLNLRPDRLMALGWRPRHTLEEMLRRLTDSMRAELSNK